MKYWNDYTVTYNMTFPQNVAEFYLLISTKIIKFDM